MIKKILQPKKPQNLPDCLNLLANRWIGATFLGMSEKEFSMTFPDEPGIHQSGDDGSIAILHQVGQFDNFNDAATAVFAYLKQCEANFPGSPRHLFIEIEGHEGPQHGYDEDFFEFQQDFLLGALGPFFSSMHLPATGSLMNNQAQSNDIPDRLDLKE